MGNKGVKDDKAKPIFPVEHYYYILEVMYMYVCMYVCITNKKEKKWL